MGRPIGRPIDIFVSLLGNPDRDDANLFVLPVNLDAVKEGSSALVILLVYVYTDVIRLNPKGRW
jgi:hypothetical protein